jgi:hypothetical protein
MSWGPQYLLPAEKWWPLYWPNAEWMVMPFPPAFDANGNRLAPVPPDGTPLHWWQMPKDQWPASAWEPKIFGAWPASKITMAEDLSIPSVWPGPMRAPPFGFIKIKMPGTPDISGDQTPKGNQIPFVNMKMHMRPHWVSHFNHLKIISRDTPMGEKFYLMDHNWEQYDEYSPAKISAAIKRRRDEKFREMLAEEIVRSRGMPKPSVDLFL